MKVLAPIVGMLLVGVAWVGSSAGQQAGPTRLERGRLLFETYCVVCHGVDGRADTTVGRLLTPRPRNLSDPVEVARVTPDRMYEAIKEGRPGTAMAPWSAILDEFQIGDVIEYILNLNQQTGGMSREELSLRIGRRIYARDCASCHGREGRADTPAAAVLTPPPAKFADPIEMARLDDGRMYAAIKLGRPGTAMGGYRDLLSPLEIIDVMRYVRTLVEPLPPGVTQADLDVQVGQRIYASHCAVCHGQQGDGDTPLGRGLVPRPRDFTQAPTTGSMSDDYLAQIVTNGKPGTAMAPWRGILNAEDVRRVILFIRRTFQRAS